MRPTIAQLESFLAVARTLSFRRAADETFTSQSALSAQVMRLEELLGARLLERDRRRVLLTPKGEAAVPLCNAVLAAVDALAGAMRRGGDELAGTLRLGVIPTIAPYVVPRLLPALARAHPDARLLLREDLTARLVAMVQAAELDVLLVDVDADLGALHREPVFADAFVLAVHPGHPLAGRDRVAMAELDDHELMLLEDGHCMSERIRAFCRRPGGEGVCDFRATSLPTLVQMVASSGGATLLPEMAARDLRATATLRLIPFADPAPARRIGLAWRHGDGRAGAFHALARLLEQSC
jgi:LysR family hydrogen peroxide-inducible transcriptional activator